MILFATTVTVPIIEAIAAAGTIADTAKKILEATRTNPAVATEMASNLIRLTELAVDVKIALADAQEEIRALKRTIVEMERARDIALDMEYQQDGGFFLSRSEANSDNPGPYCPICWGDQHKRVALAQTGHDGVYDCNIHKTRYRTGAAWTRANQATKTSSPRPVRFKQTGWLD